MNREIKFRAWNDKNKEMIFLLNTGIQYFDFEGNYALSFVVDGYDGFWSHEQYDAASKDASTFPIMQCTGLKDKNDKEIYEGDLVSIGLLSDNKPHEIVFGEYCIGKDEWGVEYKTSCFCVKFSDGSGYTGIRSDVEIIGNIYENPELLKK